MGNQPTKHAEMAPSIAQEVNEYDKVVRGAAPGVQVPLKKFSLTGQFQNHFWIRDHPDLLAVTLATADDKDSWNSFAIKNSSVGRDLVTLIGDGQKHDLIVELGPPSRRLKVDRMFEIIRVWKAR